MCGVLFHEGNTVPTKGVKMGEIYGWIGRILRVDLTKGTAWIDDTTKYSKRFIGGRGIAAKIAWDEIPPGIDAFDPKNACMQHTKTSIQNFLSPKRCLL